MNRETENKIILVTRPSRWAELMARHGTSGHAQFYLKSRKLSSDTYLEESYRFEEALEKTADILGRLGRIQMLERPLLPNFIVGPEDTVVVLGQDGLVANTLKYTNGQPVIGVNPDPDQYDGQLLPFLVKDLRTVVLEVFARKRLLKSVTMAEVQMNDGRKLRAVNDVFIGPRSHTSARYEIRIGTRAENQSSSGIVVSTGMGSTGWFRSLLAGASAMVESYGYGQARIAQREMPTARHLMASRPAPKKEMVTDELLSRLDVPAPTPDVFFAFKQTDPMLPTTPKFDGSFPWDAKHLCFTVREPFPTKTTGATVVYGKVTDAEPLEITSKMPENGVIFSDGIEADFLEFNSGDIATVGLSDRVGKLVV